MRGIILAGGRGTRLHPLTRVVCKQLLPIYDKPMIYYPLSTLMLGGIRDILIITTPEDQALFRDLLGDGSPWGISLSYAIQRNPGGIAQAFQVGADFARGRRCALILGDNIFYGPGLSQKLAEAAKARVGATIFTYWVSDPQRYGVVQFDDEDRPVALVEKPTIPPSNWAVTGLYYFDGNAVELTRTLKPSARGELEITDLNNLYLAQGRLRVERLERGFAWLDTGTHESLLQAGEFVRTVENRQGLKIGCLEEIAYLRGLIDEEQLMRLATENNSDYGAYIRGVSSRNVQVSPHWSPKVSDGE